MSNRKTMLSDNIWFAGTLNHIDGIAKVSELQKHESNTYLRDFGVTQDVLDDFNNLKTSIEKNGLRVAIKILSGTWLMIGGHTRLKALIELGVDNIPFVYVDRPDEIVELFGEEGEVDANHPAILQMLADDNITVKVETIARYKAVRFTMEQKERYEGRECTNAEIRTFCGNANLAFQTYLKLDLLENGGTFRVYGKNKAPVYLENRKKDLFRELEQGKEGKTVAGQFKSMLEDYKLLNDPNYKLYDRDSKLEKLLEKVDYETVSAKVNEEISRISDRSWFVNTDLNFKSATSHHILVDTFVTTFNDLGSKDYFAVAVENQGRYDIHFKSGGTVVNTLEVKTTIQEGWASATEKYGYALLFKFSPKLDRCFLHVSYLDVNWVDTKGQRLWKKGGGVAALSKRDLLDYLKYPQGLPFENKQETPWYVQAIGDLYYENNSKVIISTIPFGA